MDIAQFHPFKISYPIYSQGLKMVDDVLDTELQTKNQMYKITNFLFIGS